MFRKALRTSIRFQSTNYRQKSTNPRDFFTSFYESDADYFQKSSSDQKFHQKPNFDHVLPKMNVLEDFYEENDDESQDYDQELGNSNDNHSGFENSNENFVKNEISSSALESMSNYHRELAALFNKTKNAVCAVHTYRGVSPRGHGTGCFIESEGVILTCAHVVKSEKTVYVSIGENPSEKLPAEVVISDPINDLAIIRLKSPIGEMNPEKYNFPTIKLAEKDTELQEGDFVMGIGNPSKLYRSWTTGFITNLSRDLAVCLRRGGLEKYERIQHTALNGPGYSGGPLLNIKGELIGVHTNGSTGAPKMRGTPFGFATKLDGIWKIYEEFKNKTCKYELGMSYSEFDGYWLVDRSKSKDLQEGDKILNPDLKMVKSLLYKGENIMFQVERVTVENGVAKTEVKSVNVKPVKKPCKI